MKFSIRHILMFLLGFTLAASLYTCADTVSVVNAPPPQGTMIHTLEQPAAPAPVAPFYHQASFVPAPTESDGPSEGGGNMWLQILAVLYTVYEIVVRRFPSVRSYSILTYIIRIIALVLPDKDTKGTEHPVETSSMK